MRVQIPLSPFFLRGEKIKKYKARIVPELVDGGCSKGFCEPPKDLLQEIEGYVAYTTSERLETKITKEIAKVVEEVIGKIYENVGDEFDYVTIHRLVNNALEDEIRRMMYNGSGRGACNYHNGHVYEAKK